MNILIIGHYGGKNFGDEAMLYSLLTKLVEKGKYEITVVTKKRERDYLAENGVNYISPSLFGVLKKIWKADLLILGGGTHFHDGYNNERLKNHYVYLSKILLLYLVCFLLNKKIYQLGVGYGPFQGKLIRFFSAISLRLSTFTYVRDRSSFRWLSNLDLSMDKTDVSFDLVGLFSNFQNSLSAQRKAEKEWIGLSLTSLEFNEYNIGDDFWTDHFIPSLEKFFREKNIKIKIFVFRGGQKESDFYLSKKVYETLLQLDKERVALIDFTEDVEKFIYEINSCQKFIATRYHSAVIAYLCQCELFIIPYHKKLLSLARDIKISESAVFNIETGLQEDIDFRMKDFLLDQNKKFKASLDVQKAIEKSQKNISVFDNGQ